MPSDVAVSLSCARSPSRARVLFSLTRQHPTSSNQRWLQACFPRSLVLESHSDGGGRRRHQSRGLHKGYCCRTRIHVHKRVRLPSRSAHSATLARRRCKRSLCKRIAHWAAMIPRMDSAPPAAARATHATTTRADITHAGARACACAGLPETRTGSQLVVAAAARRGRLPDTFLEAWYLSGGKPGRGPGRQRGR